MQDVNPIARQIKSDLAFIESLTNVVLTEYSDYRPADFLFDGTVSLSEFAATVYFEFCALNFINTEPTISCNKFAAMFRHKCLTSDKAPDIDESSIKFSIDWAGAKEQTAVSRSLEREVSRLCRQKTVTINTQQDQKMAEALSGLKAYEDSSCESKSRAGGNPLTLTYAYQLFTNSYLQTRDKNAWHYLSQGRTSTAALNQFYDEQARFFENFMLEEYQEKFSSAHVEDYIARSINIKAYERCCMFNTAYRFADLIYNRAPDFFHTEPLAPYIFSTSCMPPVFYPIFPRYSDVSSRAYMNERLQTAARIFCSAVKSLGCTNEKIRNPGYLMPYYNRYLSYFLEATEEKRWEEEMRYYTLSILSIDLIRKLAAADIIEFSNKKFGLFISSFYGIHSLYADEIKFHHTHPLTKKSAAVFREVASHLAPTHKSRCKQS